MKGSTPLLRELALAAADRLTNGEITAPEDKTTNEYGEMYSRRLGKGKGRRKAVRRRLID